MKTTLLWFSAFAVMGLVAGLYWRSPTIGVPVGPVSIVLGPASTNSSGIVTRRVLLRNGGPYALAVNAFMRIQQDGRWNEPAEGGQIIFESESEGAVLEPGRGLGFELRPRQLTNRWRLEVLGQRHYDRKTYLGRLRFEFDWRVRKRAYIETFYSDEMEP